MRFVLLLWLLTLAGCADNSRAVVQTVRDAFGSNAAAADAFKTDPRYRYLRVTHQGGVAILILGGVDKDTRGVIPIVPTPFNEDGSIAFGDIAKLVAYYEACGVVGLTILGVMGEAQKLSWEETLAVVREFLKQSRDRHLVQQAGVVDPDRARRAHRQRSYDRARAAAIGSNHIVPSSVPRHRPALTPACRSP